MVGACASLSTADRHRARRGEQVSPPRPCRRPRGHDRRRRRGPIRGCRGRIRVAIVALAGQNPRVDLAHLEAEVLKLAAGDRARLAEKLIASLETFTEEENERIWLEEAARRDAELDADPSRGRPAEDVLRELRARFA